jgi:hypothetical protein
MDRIANTPHDLTNPHELKDALSTAIGSYMAHYGCWARQAVLLDDYDEVLEDSDFAAWLRRGRDQNGSDTLAADVLASLGQSEHLLSMAADRARETLSLLMKVVFTSPPDIQAMVWDAAHDVPAEEMDALLAGLFDELAESGHECGEQDADTFFLAFFHEYMKEYT